MSDVRLKHHESNSSGGESDEVINHGNHVKPIKIYTNRKLAGLRTKRKHFVAWHLETGLLMAGKPRYSPAGLATRNQWDVATNWTQCYGDQKLVAASTALLPGIGDNKRAVPFAGAGGTKSTAPLPISDGMPSYQA